MRSHVCCLSLLTISSICVLGMWLLLHDPFGSSIVGRIRAGMAEQEVRRICGEPVGEYRQRSVDVLRWTVDGDGSLSVWFAKDGVIGKEYQAASSVSFFARLRRWLGF
jgi:hypothetical protein